jgi:hypothetical protein
MRNFPEKTIARYTTIKSSKRSQPPKALSAVAQVVITLLQAAIFVNNLIAQISESAEAATVEITLVAKMVVPISDTITALFTAIRTPPYTQVNKVTASAPNLAATANVAVMAYIAIPIAVERKIVTISLPMDQIIVVHIPTIQLLPRTRPAAKALQGKSIPIHTRLTNILIQRIFMKITMTILMVLRMQRIIGFSTANSNSLV